MKNNLFQSSLEWVYSHFKKNTAKMLVITGTVGWGLSSLAQIGAVLFNPKISPEQKSFLIPQEMADAAVNIGAFFLITQAAKKFISKMASTGKIAPTSVREYLNKHFKKNEIGKLSLDLDKVLETSEGFPKDSYYAYKNYVTTLGTVGASVLSCNIVTPLLRNKLASSMQKHYIDKKNTQPQLYNTTRPNANMKI